MLRLKSMKINCVNPWHKSGTGLLPNSSVQASAAMIKNYLRSAFRSLQKNKAHSFINLSGLGIGMAVTLLIGLWICDEAHFDTRHTNYSCNAQVMLNGKINGSIQTDRAIPLPLDAEMRKKYSSDFTHMVMSLWNNPHVLTEGEKKVPCRENFMRAAAPVA
jgi:putative ABC transport system permease protein